MTINLERFKEIQSALKAWFSPEAHVERDLPGGGVWWYVPWQLIRERLDEVASDWQVDYTDPVYLEDLCVIRCRITICGIVREAPGNAPLKLISKTGKDMARGTPVERAVADAFKSCCEAFGICRYLDDQADKKTKEDFIRYLHKGGNGRAVVNYQNNQAIANGSQPKKPANPPAKPFGGSGSTKSAPPKKETPTTTVKVDQSVIRAQLETICKLCQFQWKEVTRLCQITLNKSESELLPDDARKVRGLLLMEWATMQYEIEWKDAVSHWKKFFVNGCSDLADQELFDRWKTYLAANVEGKW
jgi:hypothetical protein